MKRILFAVCFVLFSAFLLSGVTIEEQTKLFELNGVEYTVKVVGSFSGTDIIVSSENFFKKITASIPGENLFPQAFVSRRNFFVSWIQYKKGNVKLYLYDSKLNTSRILISEKFKFIGNAKPVYRRGLLRALLFLGLTKDNDDIYMYDIYEDTYKNITNTPDFEKRFKLDIVDACTYLNTETNDEIFKYKINLLNLKVKLVERSKKKITTKTIKTIKIKSGYSAYNRIIAFGDSITWGKMRMDEFKTSSDQHWTEVEYHPELTYWGQLAEMINTQYGSVSTVNLGVCGDPSLAGKERMDSDFSHISGYFCLVMFGTNDVGGNTSSMPSVSENLEWIIQNARDNYNMYPIIMTVPPQQNKLLHTTLQFYKENTIYLNTLIVEMAAENNIPCVDSYKAFFESEEGWQACLEDYKGNHPSPLGHRYIMDLIKPIVLNIKPRIPKSVHLSFNGKNNISISWGKNIEFDFYQYDVEYGFYANQLNRKFTTLDNSHIFYKNFINNSFQQKLFIRLRAIDRDGNKSNFSRIFSFNM